MSVVTLYNDYHNTEAVVRPNHEGIVSPRARANALRKLCGIDGCTCGGIRGPQDYRVETIYAWWDLKGGDKFALLIHQEGIISYE